MNISSIVDLAKKEGFTAAGPLDIHTIHLMPEVRDMCNSDKCRMFGRNWACPPACGTLDECAKEIISFENGIIVQTVGYLEDSMDFETMQETEQKHKKIFETVADLLRERFRILPLGAGTCQRCSTCTYPDAPCRFPHRKISSMEAYGMLVSQICKDNNIPYYYGTNTIAYTSCYLIEE